MSRIRRWAFFSMLLVAISAIGAPTPGSMSTPRVYATSTLLPNGKVLITGGFNGTVYLTAAELYDPLTGTFSPTADAGSKATHLTVARAQHSATLLRNGKVLIAGGTNATGQLTSAELFDPSTGAFTLIASSMSVARYEHTATLLRNGQVLLAGGAGVGSDFHSQDSADLYDPGTNAFTPAATHPMNEHRAGHTATLLPDGTVLLAGGNTGVADVATTEIYSAAVGFTPGPTMNAPRSFHTATLLGSLDQVIIAGGQSNATILNTFDTYNVSGNSFSAAAGLLQNARSQHTATLVGTGAILFTGGFTATGPIASAELYVPGSGTQPGAALGTAREYHSATGLLDGRVLICGGRDSTSYLSSAEIYDPRTPAFTPGNSTNNPRTHHTSTLLPNGKVFIDGGTAAAAASELFDPANGGFTPTGSPVARSSHTATLLANGKVLLAGGTNGTNDVASTRLYNAATNAFLTSPDMATPREQHTATLLGNGRVLIVGGLNGSTALNTAEVYDPVTNAIAPAPGNLTIARYGHTATLLADGRVLIAGGNGPGASTSVELFDPSSGTFSAGHVISSHVAGGAAALLRSGKVLIIGAGSQADVYDPATNTVVSIGPLPVTGAGLTATVLATGEVLVAGGGSTNAAIFDPVSNTFQTISSMNVSRNGARATLLESGAVLMTGGAASRVTEQFDFGFARAYAPASLNVTAVYQQVQQPGNVVIFGTNIVGQSAASSGATNDSATNLPVLQMQRVDNDATFIVPALGAESYEFYSVTVSGLPVGFYRATIYASGFPSQELLILIANTAAPFMQSMSPRAGPVAGGQSVTISGFYLDGAGVTIDGVDATVTSASSGSVVFNTPPHAAGTVVVTVSTIGGWSSVDNAATAPMTYEYVDPPTVSSMSPATGITDGGDLVTLGGTNLSTTSQVTFDGIAATNLTAGATVTVRTPQHALGSVPVVVTAAGGTASPPTTFTYTLGAATNVSATIVSAPGAVPVQVSVSWSPVFDATSYQVLRSTDDVTYTLVAAGSGTSLTDVNASANAAYLYRVVAKNGSNTGPSSAGVLVRTFTFTDPTLTAGTTVIAAVHLTELRDAVTKLCTLGHVTVPAFTDPTIVAGSTPVRMVHIAELRSLLNQGRAAFGLAPVAFTDDPLTTITAIKAVHIVELRQGVAQ